MLADAARRRTASATAWTSISSATTARRRRSRTSSQCFADASGRDLTQFMLWYSQAGTPEVVGTGQLRCRGQDLSRSTLAQIVPPTPGPADQGADGHPARHRPGRPRRPRPAADARRRPAARARRARARPSRRRPSSSPASPSGRCSRSTAASRRRSSSPPICAPAICVFLAAHDSDPFNRWQAVQTLATRAAGRQRGAAPRRAGPATSTRACSTRSPRSSPTRRLEPAFVAAGAGSCRARPTSPARSAATSIRTRSSARAHGAARADRRLHLNAALTRRYRAPGRQRRPTARTRPAPAGARSRTSASTCSPPTRKPDAIALAATQYQRRRQHDRPHGGARHARRCTTCRSARPRSTTSTSATATIRSSSTNGSRCRRSMPEPGDARPRARAHRAPGLLARQSQPRPRADRRLRPGQPDAVQPRRRRRLRLRRRHASSRSIRPIRRSRRG